MIDFVKIVIKDENLISLVWNNPLLEYHAESSKRVSVDEIKETSQKKVKNLIFTAYYNRMEITGSLHYYSNDGIHNANDFSFNDCTNVLKDLEQSLNLDLSKCFIVNLEFGFNILPSIPVTSLITWLKYHGRNEFRSYPSLKYAKQSTSFNKSNKANFYKIIKAYAKGLQQFNGTTYADANTFRFEVKSKKSRYINKLGIYTLADLSKIEVHQNLVKELIKEWHDVLLLDKYTVLEDLKKEQKYLSSDFWENALQGHRNTFTKHRNLYFQFLSEYPENIHASIEKILIEKSIELIKPCAISPPLNTNNRVHIYQYIRGDYAHTNKNQCIVNGLDISMQKDDSFLLSHSGLRYYFKDNPNLFESIKQRYLSVRWINSDFEIQIREIAHSIRNTVNNIRISYLKKHPANQFEILFDTG